MDAEAEDGLRVCVVDHASCTRAEQSRAEQSRAEQSK